MNEGIVLIRIINEDLLSNCQQLLDDNKINNRVRGRSTILVARKDLENASKLVRTIDPDYKITVASQS